MDKVAMITGGSRGIGFGIAKHLALAGYHLAINGVRDEREAADHLSELKTLGAEVVYCQGNIGLKEDREQIFGQVIAAFGRVNVLVNNAGIAPRKRVDFLEVEEDDFDHLMNINQKGTFFMSQLVAKWMIKNKTLHPEASGHIINITSVSSEAASVLRSEYCMSKASLTMLNKILAIKMADHGIPVHEIQPGFVDTDMITTVRDKYIKLADELVLEKRLATPDDIGKIVTSLVTGGLPYCTGQVIRPDGGLGIWRF